MTIREIINGFRVPMDKGLPSDDSAFTYAYFYHLMKICRGVLLYDKIKDPDYNYSLNFYFNNLSNLFWLWRFF